MLEKWNGRNGTAEFARRSMNNLDFILLSSRAGDVHPVTQTVTSLLAILVFPWERSAFYAITKKRLTLLVSEGWPKWDMTGQRVEENKVKTVGDLVELLRNSIAHGNVVFDSDSKGLAEVKITFENRPNGGEADWIASIKAAQLVQFCRRFSEFIEDFVK